MRTNSCAGLCTSPPLSMGRGGAVVFENQPDRGCADSPDSVLRGLYEPKFANHCPLWLLPEMRRVQRDLGLREVTFAQCQLGGSFQKWTTLWYSHTLAPILDDLHMCVCTHADGEHPEVARDRTARGDWISAEAAAYPAQMNALFADAIEHHCVNLPHADSRFNPAVQTWYAVGPTNHMTKCEQRTVVHTDLTDASHVHVWSHTSLAHCKEEADWRARNSEQAPTSITWFGGPAVDFGFLDSPTAP